MPWRKICALPAFWVSLLYDDGAMDAAWDLCKHWNAEERQKLRDDVPGLGLKAEIAGRSVQQISADLLEIGTAGLASRARASDFDRDEGHFLNALRDVVERGETPAEEMLWKYEHQWNGDIDRVFGEYSY